MYIYVCISIYTHTYMYMQIYTSSEDDGHRQLVPLFDGVLNPQPYTLHPIHSYGERDRERGREG